MNFIETHKLTIIGVLIGAVDGYLYYYHIGCVSGTCLITSKPINSTLYGSVMGGLFLNMFQKENTKQS